MNRGFFIFLLLITITSLVSRAQSLYITGSVRDADTREPLAYASLQVVGDNVGTTTNERGNFSLEIGAIAGAKLVVSFIGYKTETITLSKNQLKYTVLLKPEANALQEVVVVSGTMKEVSKMDSPIPVEIYTPALFLKNPTPSIFEWNDMWRDCSDRR